jgi:AcrR family transcriptional regulator
MEGYDQVNTGRIARECEIASGTLFNYFPTKWDLLIEVLQEVKKRGTSYFIEMIEESEDEEKRLYHMVSSMYFIIDRIGKLGREFFSFLLGQNEEIWQKLEEHDEKDEQELLRVLRRSFEQLREADDELLRNLLKSLQALVIANYTRESEMRERNIRFSCTAFRAILKDIKEIRNYTQEDECKR